MWAPNARNVEVVFSRRDHGYIADDGAGIDPDAPVITLARVPGGIWPSAPVPDFSSFVGELRLPANGFVVLQRV